MKLIKNIATAFRSTQTNTSSDHYCNDPIVIDDLGRKVCNKEAFFNLYTKAMEESNDSFKVYMVKMICSCRYHLVSLSLSEQQSFIDYCLENKVDISDEGLRLANEELTLSLTQSESFISSWAKNHN